MMLNKIKGSVLVVMCMTALMACANQPENAGQTAAKTEPVKEAASQVQASEVVNEFYEVYKDNRLYVFGEYATYKSFMESGEAAYVLTQIGQGPNRATLVFVVNKTQSKNPAEAAFVKVYKGQTEADKAFYGEVVANNRFYVFDSYPDMVAFRESGEAAYVVTHIGKGPDRKSVVLVRDKKSMKDQAATDAMYARFLSGHQL